MSFELMSPENMTLLYFSVCKLETDIVKNSETFAEIYQDIWVKV